MVLVLIKKNIFLSEIAFFYFNFKFKLCMINSHIPKADGSKFVYISYNKSQKIYILKNLVCVNQLRRAVVIFLFEKKFLKKLLFVF